MKKNLLCLILLIVFNMTFSQIGIYTVDPKATLDITAKTTDGSSPEGVIIPKLSGDQIKSSDAVFGQAQKGTLIYATLPVSASSVKTVNIIREGYYYFDGDIWRPLGSPAGPSSGNNDPTGDIKNSAKTTDHNGWYLLNGRAVSTLPANAQATAAFLGFTTNLPNATDRVLKMQTGTETIGGTGGNNTLTIARSNLPNISFSGSVSGTAATAGAHAHTPSTGSFLLGNTTINNNGHGNYAGNATPSAWAGVGMVATTNSTGDHIHNVTGSATIPTGGTGAGLDNRSSYLVVNIFIYLGE